MANKTSKMTDEQKAAARSAAAKKAAVTRKANAAKKALVGKKVDSKQQAVETTKVEQKVATMIKTPASGRDAHTYIGDNPNLENGKVYDSRSIAARILMKAGMRHCDIAREVCMAPQTVKRVLDNDNAKAEKDIKAKKREAKNKARRTRRAKAKKANIKK